MARISGKVCKLCRREGMKLFLKGQRCFSEKCAVNRRDYPPGVHTRPRKTTDYYTQLREKQKAKRIYGVLERQFQRYFSIASRQKGNTGENLLVLNAGHCFREQVLEACPGQANTAHPEGRSGSSLETIRNMVASGLGVSVLPAMALQPRYGNRLVKEVPFAEPAPSRKVAVAWRASFPRPKAIEALTQSMREVKLDCLKALAA